MQERFYGFRRLGSVKIGAMPHKQPHQVEPALVGSIHEAAPAMVLHIGSVGWCTLLEQQLSDLQVAHSHGGAERTQRSGDRTLAGIEQASGTVDIARARSQRSNTACCSFEAPACSRMSRPSGRLGSTPRSISTRTASGSPITPRMASVSGVRPSESGSSASRSTPSACASRSKSTWPKATP